MNNIQENIDFLRTLVKCSQLEFVRFVQVARRSKLLAICEIFHNILDGNIEVSDSERKALKKHRKTLRKFCTKKISAKDKKTLVQNHSFLIQSVLQKYLPKVETVLSEWIKERNG